MFVAEAQSRPVVLLPTGEIQAFDAVPKAHYQTPVAGAEDALGVFAGLLPR